MGPAGREAAGGGRPLWAGAVVVVAAAAFKPGRFRRARGVSGAACAGLGAASFRGRAVFPPRWPRVRDAAADGGRPSLFVCLFF